MRKQLIANVMCRPQNDNAPSHQDDRPFAKLESLITTCGRELRRSVVLPPYSQFPAMVHVEPDGIHTVDEQVRIGRSYDMAPGSCVFRFRTKDVRELIPQRRWQIRPTLYSQRSESPSRSVVVRSPGDHRILGSPGHPGQHSRVPVSCHSGRRCR
jgi:hypothetical protein